MTTAGAAGAASEVKLGILKGNSSAYRYYRGACEELGVAYTEIDFLRGSWLRQIRDAACTGYLARPPANYLEANSLYMDRLYLLTTVVGARIYPSYGELFLYENKSAMYDWLSIHGFPHLETLVSADRAEVLRYLESAHFPLILKARIGHGSKSVIKMESLASARRIAQRVFGAGAPVLSKGYAKVRWKGIVPFTPHGATQKHYVILQRFVPIKWEWRMVRIGDSYFGHRKLLKGDFASGSLLKGWGSPPPELLLLLREVCETGGFQSMAMDVLETVDGRFYINELQSLFGSRDESQMYVEGKPGRYVFADGVFRFEEGVFNTHRSYGLRVCHFLELLGRSTTCSPA